uniref:Non-specific serine/threonine protein kinase (EC) n=1 Tax=Ganoderma boninense TaxID=34458 RepID=A0A5K1K543_9APHY|nr:Non-specific serine/threonine protein kinase (EC [Ganoderma boninense]
MSDVETTAVPIAESKPPMLLLIDTDAKWTGRDVDSLTLYVDAPVAALSITLPIPQRVDMLPNPRIFDDWIALIQGEAATRCEISVHQRVLLLDIALTYRAFGRGLPNVNTSIFKTFSDCLVETARTLDDHESAEEFLRSIIEWVHTKLPDVSVR